MVFAATFDVGSFTYTILNSTDVSVKLKSGATPTSITIPATAYNTAESKSYNVTTVTSSAFSGCSSITSITIGSNVTTIYGYAFKGTAVKTVTIPANVTTLNSYAFQNCTSLTKVTFDASSPLTSVGANLFDGCTKLTTVTLPPHLTALPGNIFKGCTAMEEVIIPAAVTSVASTAFNGCTSLSTIHAKPNAAPSVSDTWTTITPASIKLQLYSSAAKTSYSASSNWNSFNISTSKTGSCGASATWTLNFETNNLSISGSGAMNDYTSSTLPWIADTAYIYTVSIADDITKIGNYAFYCCRRCTNVSLGMFSKLATIGSRAMHSCFALAGFGTSSTQINIPKKVTTIGEYAFYNCTTATYVYIYHDSELTSIGANAFQGMTNLTEVTVYNAADLSTIGGSAFKDCVNMASITLPESITSIGSSAFSGCTALASETGYANYKGTLEQWAQIAFSSYDSNPACVAKKLKIKGTLITDCTLNVSVGAFAFRGITTLTSLTLGEGCISIGNYAFGGCTGLTGTLVIPSTVTTIVSNSFNGCTGYNAIDLMGATSLATIGSGAFDGMTGVAGVLYIPASVTTVNSMAFRNMTGLSKIFANPTTAPNGTNSTTFTNITSKPLYVLTAAAYTSYTTKANWSDFTNIMYGGYCGAETGGVNMTWELNPSSGLLIISGSGAMKDYSNSSTNRAPWYDLRASVLSIKICDNVTHVGAYAFNACSNATEVWTSTTVNSFGNHAFYSCSKLNVAKYGKTDVPTPVLSYATDWAQIDFGNEYANPLYYAHTLKIYKDQKNAAPAFGTVTELENRSITTIKPYAFYGCTSLTSVALHSNVTSVDKYAFYGCSNLTSVTLPDNVETLGYRAFYGCSLLSSITIPQNVTKVGDGLFTGCSLTTVIWNAENCAKCLSSSGNEYALSSAWNPFLGTTASDPRNTITSFTFGDNVEIIPNGLCYNMVGLTSISIPAGVTSIGTNVFQGCSNLHTINWNATNCDDFTSGTAPFESIKTAITAFNFGHGVRHIPAYLCKGMTNMNGLSAGVGVLIPTTVKSIGTDAFDGCSQFNRIDYKANNNYSLTHVDDWGQINFANDKANPLYYSGHLYIIMPPKEGSNSVPGFGEVRTPVFKDTTTYINSYAFVNCSSITSVTFGSSMSSIAANAFAGCTGIASVTSNAVEAPSISSTSFPDEVKSNAPLTLVSCESKEDYLEEANWDFTTIYPNKVEFNLKGHGSQISSQCVEESGTAEEPSDDPSADYYTFGGWFDNEGFTGNAFDFSSEITSDLTLFAKWTENVYTFADTDEDNSKIAAANNKLASSITIGRTIWKDSYYNSMCLPFGLSADQIADSPLAGYKALKRLSEATVTGDGSERVLNIQLEPISEITAGEPFFISYDAGENIVNPVFDDVMVTTTAPSTIVEGDVTCRGLFYKNDIGAETTNLFVGENNTLYWPKEGKSTMKGFRAYFSINPASSAVARGMRVRFVDRMPTGVEKVSGERLDVNGKKILYEGQLFILRDGKTYNAQGALIK